MYIMSLGGGSGTVKINFNNRTLKCFLIPSVTLIIQSVLYLNLILLNVLFSFVNP